MRRWAEILLVGLLLRAAMAAAPKAVPMKTFTDAAHGVSFQYPSIWTRVAKPGDYLQSFVQSAGSLQPVAEFVFSPDGNFYAKTVLSGLAFLYFAVPDATKVACLKRGNLGGAATVGPERKMIGGIVYTHTRGGDAAMSHQLSTDVYAAWRGGTCYLFEEDMRSIAPGVEDGKRDLTKAEVRTLQRHLDTTMLSVTIR